MCAVLLPPGVNLIAVNKHIKYQSSNFGIAGSNPAEGTGVQSLVLVVCCVGSGLLYWWCAVWVAVCCTGGVLCR